MLTALQVKLSWYDTFYLGAFHLQKEHANVR